jgi:hypothetical protein
MEHRHGEREDVEFWDEDELEYRSEDIRETVRSIFAHANEIAEKHGLGVEGRSVTFLENKYWWDNEDSLWEGFNFVDFLGDAKGINLVPILARERDTTPLSRS